MSATAANLARIAAAPGVRAAAFDRARPDPALVSVAALLADPDGGRVAAAFLSIGQPGSRAALVQGVEYVAAALAGDTGAVP